MPPVPLWALFRNPQCCGFVTLLIQKGSVISGVKGVWVERPCSERSNSHQSYTGVAPVCNLDGDFTHSTGGAEREHQDAPGFGAGCFFQLIFPAWEPRAGPGGQDG